MTIFAYIYRDPLLEPIAEDWCWEMPFDRLYQDLGQRQQWQQLWEDCQTGQPQQLLLRTLEELGDTAIEVGDRLEKLEALGIEIIATKQAYRTSANNTKAHLLKLLAAIAQNQRCNRLRQGHARNRLNALPPPGKAPYGYRRGKDRYLLDRSTAPVVKDFCDRFLLYGSLRGAVLYLEKRYGKKISASTGRRWLTSPVYRGDLLYQNQNILRDTHSALLSREEAAQIDRLLRRNGRLPARTASAPRSLAGLTLCAQCQSPMTITRACGRGKSKEYLYLRPARCPLQPHCRALSYEKILEATIDNICKDLPSAVAELNLPDLSTIKTEIDNQIEQKQAILSQLPSLQATGILDEDTALLRAYTLRTDLAQLQDRLAQLPPVNLAAIAQAVSIPQFWLDLSEAERRFYFREFIRHIEIVRPNLQSWRLNLVFIF